MNGDQGLAFLSFCKKVLPTCAGQACVSQHPCFTAAEADLLAWRLAKQAGSAKMSLESIVHEICSAVSKHLDPSWIAELHALCNTGSGYGNFFGSQDELRSFLFLRTHLVVELLKICTPWAQIAFPSPLFTPECIAAISAADCTLVSQEDLDALWSGLVTFCVDFSAKESKESLWKN